MAKNRRTPRPFKYRGRWRAQVTLSNGTRPTGRPIIPPQKGKGRVGKRGLLV